MHTQENEKHEGRSVYEWTSQNLNHVILTWYPKHRAKLFYFMAT